MLPETDWCGEFALDARVLPDRPVRVLFGKGAVKQVGQECLRLGDRVLLIAGPHEDAAADRVTGRLGSAVVGRLREVTQHVPVELAHRAAGRAAELGAEVLLAIGGGSATGLAKAVARATGLPILAVPTTYAGSEMTPVWGLTDSTGKTTGRDPRVLPATVVYDPLLTVSLPAPLTAASGMNAVAHAIEALYAPDADRLPSGAAEAAVRAMAAALPEAVRRPDDLPARAEAMYGAWLAGWSLGSTTMGLHHKLAHVLGGRYRLPHAGTHSALLPQVAAFNAPAAQEPLGRAARALGVGDAGRVGAALFDLATAVGAPTSLGAQGLPEDAVEEVAAEVATAGITNPRPFDEAEVAQLLRDALVGRHP